MEIHWDKSIDLSARDKEKLVKFSKRLHQFFLFYHIIFSVKDRVMCLDSLLVIAL